MASSGSALTKTSPLTNFFLMVITPIDAVTRQPVKSASRTVGYADMTSTEIELLSLSRNSSDRADS